MFNRPNQSGFTIIELLLVTVVLAVLSANALGKFTTLSREARIASVTSIAGALSSTSTLFHLKASVQGVTDGSIVVEGNDVAIDRVMLVGIGIMHGVMP